MIHTKVRIRLSVLLGCAVLATQTLAQTAVRGKLERIREGGTAPAPYVQVVLYPTGSTPVTATTGPDGRFEFYGVASGAEEYTLEIPTVKLDGSNGQPMKRTIMPQGEIYEVEPIVVNDFTFALPPSGAQEVSGSIEASGSHGFPVSTCIWLVPQAGVDEYLLRNLPVQLAADGTWVRDNIEVDASITWLHAVLLTPEGLLELQNRIQSGDNTPSDEMPLGSRAIASRRITVTPD